MRPKRRAEQPIRHPFIEIAGDVFLIMDWFDIDDGKRGRDILTLARLTPTELRLYDCHSCVADAVGFVSHRVAKRLHGAKRG